MEGLRPKSILIFSTLLIIREIQVKIAVRCHLAPIRMAAITNMENK